MSALTISVLEIEAERYAVAPTLAARLRIEESTGAQVHAISLRCQVRIEPQRRGYGSDERQRLVELFGLPEQWAKTLTPFLWTHTSVMVRGFSEAIEVDLPLACTYDFEVAASKYLHSLGDGDVPLVFLFTGTIFTKGQTGFAVEQVPWDLEASYRMPVRVWRDVMDVYFPNSGWIRVDRETLDALTRFRAERALPSWEAAFAELLPAPVERAS